VGTELEGDWWYEVALRYEKDNKPPLDQGMQEWLRGLSFYFFIIYDCINCIILVVWGNAMS
jgi:hypothetical protein